MSSTPTLCSSLTVYNSKEEKEKYIDKELIKRLRDQIEHTRKAATDLETGLIEIDSIYRTKFPELVGRLSDLTNELNLIEYLRQQAKESKKDKAQEETQKPEKEVFDKIISKAKKKLKQKVVILFRRISNLSHPDKIGDRKYDNIRKQLTDLFIEARIAYKAHDYICLSAIFKQVREVREKAGVFDYFHVKMDDYVYESDETSAYDLFIEEKRMLENQLSNIMAETQYMANSKLFSVLNLHCSRQFTAASSVYKSLLQSKIEGVTEQINLATTHPTN